MIFIAICYHNLGLQEILEDPKETDPVRLIIAPKQFANI